MGLMFTEMPDSPILEDFDINTAPEGTDGDDDDSGDGFEEDDEDN